MTKDRADALVRDLQRDGYAARARNVMATVDTAYRVDPDYVVEVEGCGWPLTQAEKLAAWGPPCRS
jgi:hypothetical protein